MSVEDGSDAGLRTEDARMVLDLIGRHLNSPDAKVSALRRSEGRTICGSVDVKNRDGLYTGPRGFVVDLANDTFDRVPDGPELLSARPRATYERLERQRQLYFRLCLDQQSESPPCSQRKTWPVDDWPVLRGHLEEG
ncbi:hypothetical protein [Methylobacterium radiodurans]|nr:hypothetical protein [Methylobacterium radiodurans]